VLIECKHEQRKVERQAVQVLHAKMVSTGAQKGMLFSVAGFQAGAIEYATVHGIALVQMAKGSSTWFTRSFGAVAPRPAWADYPEYVGWWCHGNSMSVLSSAEGRFTRCALGVDAEPSRDTGRQ
jgi:restriction system protein